MDPGDFIAGGKKPLHLSQIKLSCYKKYCYFPPCSWLGL